MKRYRVYRRGLSEDESLVILDFGEIPMEELATAEQEAYEMASCEAVTHRDSIGEICDEYPHLAGFEPWLWERSSWQPKGLNRDYFLMHRRHSARAELLEFLRRFVIMNGRYVDSSEIREILENVLSEMEPKR